MRHSFLHRVGLALGALLIIVGMLYTAAAAAQDSAESDAAPPARLQVYVFEQGRPVEGLTVRYADQVGRTDDNGHWRTSMAPAADRLTVFDNALALTALPMELRAGELVQVIITLFGDERRAMVSVESSLGVDRVEYGAPAEAVTAEAVAGSGMLTGRIVSSEDGKPVAGARVFVSGTPLELRTDDDGRFQSEVSVGTYSVSVLHAEFATRTIEDVQIEPDETTERNFELPPAGLELAEFVVVEPFIEGSLSAVTAIRRESTAVTDVLSAEQISRAGDSDVGAALKRVTGLTLVGGEFVFVRGLGERYSSILFNGANLPSPDPTRRVLPMGLFPTDIISQIVVQKTSDASMPGTFGGGTVQMGSRGFPEEFLFRISYSAAYNSESTGQTGLTYDGGGRDFTGFDDDSRDVPPLLADATSGNTFLRPANRFNPEGVSPEQLEAIGEQVAALTDFSNRRKTLPVDRGFSVSLGNSWRPLPWVRTGFLASIRYSDEWRQRDELRRTFSAVGDGLQSRNGLDISRTLRNIDLSGFINGGLELGDWTRLGVNVMLLRQSEDEVEVREGVEEAQNLQRVQHEWTENQLFTAQFTGEHTAPLVGTEANWQFVTGRATREDPNVVEFRRDDGDENGVFTFSRRGDSNSQIWAGVDDDLTDWSLDLAQPLPSLGPLTVKPRGGLGRTERDRVSGRRTFSFFGNVPVGADELPQEDLLGPELIGPGGLVFREDTQATDNFTALQELDYWFGMLEIGLFERITLVGGLRHEENLQQVETANLSSPDAPPIISTIDESDDLLSGSLTLRFLDNAQLRLGYAETLSRPDLREISPAPFTDPVLDLRSVGNPDLQTTSLENLDARIEYYFNEVDSISFAWFYKELTNPIEKVVSAGASGTTIFLENALGAEVEGWEIDVYRSMGFINDWSWLDGIGMGWLRNAGLENYFVAANYADITTRVDLDPAASNQTNANRALEGASPWVVNAQIGYTHPDNMFEWTLLFNSFGARISRAGALGQPDIFEEPFAKLDFTAKYRFRDAWSIKLELENLLDSDVEFTQGEETTRLFKPGIKIGLGIEFRM